MAPMDLTKRLTAQGTTLDWAASTSADVAGYRVYRQHGTGSKALLGTTAGTVTNWPTPAWPTTPLHATRWSPTTGRGTPPARRSGSRPRRPRPPVGTGSLTAPRRRSWSQPQRISPRWPKPDLAPPSGSPRAATGVRHRDREGHRRTTHLDLRIAGRRLRPGNASAGRNQDPVLIPPGGRRNELFAIPRRASRSSAPTMSPWRT